MRKKNRLAVAFCLALTLAGCTVGPNYKLPSAAVVNAPAAEGPFHGAQIKAVTSAALPGHWWRLYKDPRLDALIEQTLAANTDLRVAEANLERSRNLLEAAKAAREPDVAIGLGANETERSAEAYVHNGPIPERGLYDVGISVSYDLDLFGRLKRGVEAASAEAEVAQAARDLARVNVAAQTVQAYAEICDAGAELAVTRRLLQLQAQNVALMQRMAQGGRSIKIDVVRQEEQQDQLRATVPAFTARQARALYRLAVLAGRPPGQFDATLTDCHAALRMTTPMPVGDGESLLRRRPDVRAAERRLAAATAEIGVETAALYPTVQLGASLGSTGAIKDFVSPLTQRYSAGPVISWHLNHSVARARIAAANADAKAELARFDAVVLKALEETEAALAVYARDLDRQSELEAGLTHARKLAEAAHEMQSAGRTNAVATLTAERAFASAEQTLAVNQSQISRDQIALFLALGGGWER
jgi:NodT family efflux transporter outer membrane factor (OMF) lipoprotein